MKEGFTIHYLSWGRRTEPQQEDKTRIIQNPVIQETQYITHLYWAPPIALMKVQESSWSGNNMIELIEMRAVPGC